MNLVTTGLGRWRAVGPLLGLLLLTALGLLLVVQLPVHYAIVIGRDEGWHSDLPLLVNWNDPEQAEGLRYRWSARDSHVIVPGVGQRPLVANLRLLPVPPGTSAPLVIQLPAATVSLPLPLSPRTVTLLTPPTAGGTVDLTIAAPLFIAGPSDSRDLGVRAAGLTLTSFGRTAALPGWRLWWPLPVVALVWGLLWWTWRSRRWATLGTALLAATLLALAAADLPRWVLLGGPLLASLLWGLALATGLAWLFARTLPRRTLHPPAAVVRGVLLLLVALWTVRYTARLYPEAMVGDLGFHANRSSEVSKGMLFIVSRHRGINFPYPSGFYTLLLPVALLPVNLLTIVEWMDALWGTLGILPLAYLGWYVGCRLDPADSRRAGRLALFSAGGYAALAPAMMALFWSFLPHIFTQEWVSLLLAGLVGGWAWLAKRRGIVLTFVGLSLVFFGHIGLYINLSLLLGWVWLWRWFHTRDRDERRRLQGLLLAFTVAQVVVLLLFYSSYWQLVSDKLQAFSAGGMSAVQENRAPASRRSLLLDLWQPGLGEHYAWIALPLALLGGVRLWRRLPGELVTTLWWGTLVVALVQAMIPFLTRSTITTRWLSFSAWLVALGLALVADLLWRRGRAGALVVVGLYGWVAGNTLFLWLKAGGFRIRPPEPF